MDILCWRWNADLKVEFEDLSRQMSELSRLPAGLRGSIGRQIALVQASAKEEAPVRRFGSGGGELRQKPDGLFHDFGGTPRLADRASLT